MKVTCSRRLTFEAGHRLVNHEGKCAHLHGHSYKVRVTAESKALDGLGRVVDFSVLKERIGGWIDANWDHAFIWNAADPILGPVFSDGFAATRNFRADFNPTAENLAEFLLDVVCPRVLDGTGVTVTRVVVEETENCQAEASL